MAYKWGGDPITTYEVGRSSKYMPDTPRDWNIYHRLKPNVGKYSIYGAYGYDGSLEEVGTSLKA